LALAFFTVSQLGRLGGQLLQPFGQAFELLVCVELVQAVNADLNRLGVVVGDTVDVFGAAHDLLIVAGGSANDEAYASNKTLTMAPAAIRMSLRGVSVRQCQRTLPIR
jgi:hypothetical protein